MTSCRDRGISPLLLWAVACLLALTQSARADTTQLTLTDATACTPLHALVDVLEDPDGLLTIADVRQTAADRFREREGARFSWGFTRSAYWYRLEIRNAGQQHLTRLLDVHTAWIDEVDLHLFSPDGTAGPRRLTGDALPHIQREIPHRAFLFTLELPPGVTTCYLRIKSRQALLAPVTLWPPEAFAQHDRAQAYYFGAFYGALTLLLLFNIVISVALRRRSYAMYCLFLAAAMLMTFAYNGFAFGVLWPRAPGWANVSYSLFIILFQLTGLLFAIAFLNTRNKLPRLHRITLAVMGLILAAPLFSAIIQSSRLYNASAVYAVFIFAPLMVILGIAARVKGDRAAGYFVIASMATVIGACLTAGTVAGAFPYHFATFHAVEFGILIDMALLSLALADRLRLSRRESEILREEALRKQQAAREELEHLVKVRTSELEGLYDLTRQISDATTVVEVLDDLYSALAAFLPFDRIALALLDSSAERVTAVWARCAASPTGIDSGYGQSLAESSLGQVLESHEPRIISDLEAYLKRHPLSDSTRRIVSEGLRSNLTVPLYALRRPVGFLFLASHEPGTYKPAHSRFMQQIAGHLAIVIEKSKLFTSLHEAQESLRQTNAQLEDLAHNDGLTGLANRRALDAALQSEWNRCGRNGTPLTFLMLDIDWFKRFNDHYGHQRGDQCLQDVAKALETVSRRTGDVAARYGGEEFSLLLPNCDAASAGAIAAEVRKRIATQSIEHARSLYGRVTVSVGGATVIPSQTPTSPDTLVSTADAALYEAKHRGRDHAVTRTVA